MFQGHSNLLTSSEIRKQLTTATIEKTVVNYNKNGEIIYLSYWGFLYLI
jgi:hypothetical protein